MKSTYWFQGTYANPNTGGAKGYLNLIFNSPHQAIHLSGNNHLIEYNEIRTVCRETSDSGAIYMGLDWSMRGNVFRYNYLHDINQGGGATNHNGINGLYLDDFFSGSTIFGNVFCNVDQGVLIGGGRDNTIQNNIFVGCTNFAIRADQRGLTWDAALISNTNSVLWSSLYAMPFQSNATWVSQYPSLVLLPTNNPAAALGNVIQANISFSNTAWVVYYDGAQTNVTSTNNLTSADPLFANYAQRNFTLATNSPAWPLGFQPIPMNKFGPVPGPATDLRIGP